MWMELIKNSMRTARKNKIYTFVNISGLAIGLSSFVMIMLWVKHELSYDSHNPRAGEVFQLYKRFNTGTLGYNSSLPYPFGPAIDDEIPDVETAVRVVNRRRVVSCGDKIFRENGILAADSTFFDVFYCKFLAGSPEMALVQSNSIVITRQMAEKYFGTTDAIGKSLFVYLGKKWHFVVSGVVDNYSSHSNMQFNAVFPIVPVYKNRDEKDDWYHHSIDTYILVSTKIAADSLNNALTSTIRKYTSDDSGIEIRIQKLSEVHLKSPEGAATGLQYVIIFSITALIILVIAAINYTNMATAIAAGRMREVGLRKVFGSTRSELVGRFMFEAFVQSFVAFVLALVIVEIWLPWFRELSGKNLVLSYFSFSNILFAHFLIVLTSLMSGAFPAFYTSSFLPSSVFRGASVTGRNRTNLRRILVVVQFTIAITLVIVTMIIFSQLRYIQNKNLGYDKENLIHLPYSDDISKKYSAFKAELLANPSILHVCRCSENPAYVYNRMGGLEWEGKDEKADGRFKFISADADFFNAMKIKIKEGRSFRDDIQSDTANYIFNEAAVKVLGYADPIDKSFAIDTIQGKIVGVVEDFNIQPLTENIEPLMILNWPDWYWTMLIRIRPGNPVDAIEHIEKTWRRFAVSSPFEYGFMDSFVQMQYESEHRMGKLAVVFSVLVLLITVIGLFSLTSFTAQQRTKEAGIRKVLGASSFQLIKMFTFSFVGLTGIANLLAWPIAWYFSENWLQGFSYRVSINLYPFLLVSATSVLISVMVISYHTWRMSAANPVDSLRYRQ